MFNLNEAFKQGYEEYLQESAEQNFEQAFEALQESQIEAEKSFQVVQNYFSLYALSEGVLEESIAGLTPEKAGKQAEKDFSLEGIQSIKDLIGIIGKDAPMYKPEVGNVTLTKISEMKFPKNVIFFLQAIIDWLSNIVKKFISAFTNGIQRLFGLKEAEDFKGSLIPSLEKAKMIETWTTMPTNVKTPKAASVVNTSFDSLERINNMFSGVKLRESVDLTEAGYDEKVEPSKQVATGIMIDVTKEMQDLSQMLTHFLDLFDNAYGSNQEHLFETEDLQLLLELFKETMKSIASGRVPAYALQGNLTELDIINKNKLKDNLIRTKINVDSLKRAYVETQRGIIQKLQVITQKQLFASQGLGVSFKFYSAGTYQQMINILKVIQPRIKDAHKLEKKLARMGQIFNKVVIELGKQRRSIANFGDVTYTPVYQRKINDLFDSARFVSQTITLRLTTLGLYIKELKDVNEAIMNANSINSRSKTVLKKNIFKGVDKKLFR